MKSQLYAILLVLGVLTCFLWYGFALVDWVQDYRTGVYHHEYFEAFYETLAIALYTLLGVRFMNKRIDSF
ncbi:hypothetical protein [Larkinella harenae]